MLEHIGQKEFTDYSIKLYGRPDVHLIGSKKTAVDAAHHFIEVANEFGQQTEMHEAEYCISSVTIQKEMQAKADAFFNKHKVSVVLDPHLAAKAVAGLSRIRL